MTTLVGITAMAAFAYFETTFFYYPKRPDFRSGSIVPYQVKGFTVYITEWQNEIVHTVMWILWIAIPLMLICLVLSRLSKAKV
ncbi:MAG: hypothetical protein WDN03_15495 [Rhizomicrobium sp.]